jgi:general secretion pathway protein L
MIALRQIRSGARNLLGLWLKEWQVVMPDAFRGSSGSGSSARLIIRPDEDRVAMSVEERDGTQLLAEYCRWQDYDRAILDRFRLAARSHLRVDIDIVLSLPHAISGSLVIPQQARARAALIVKDHVARKIPMKPESLFVGYEARDAGPKLELHYLIFPKEKLEQILARLSISLPELDALEGASLAGAPPVAVACVRPRPAHTRWMARAVAGLVFIAIAAPIVSFGTLAWRQHLVVTDLEAQTAALTVEARRSTEQLKGVYGMADDLDRFAAIRSAPSVSQIWEELARLLPDATYLKEVEIKGDEIHTAGFSDAAAELIHSFEASPILHAATFTGPVVFDRAEGKEHFTLRALARKPRLPPEERE